MNRPHQRSPFPPPRDAAARLRRGPALLGAALAACLVAGHAPAQTASQVTPQTLRPDRPRLDGAVIFSGQPGLDAPAGAESLSVTIAGVTVEGELAQMAEAGRAVEARLVGRPVPVSEIFEAAQALEAAYAEAGFVLARVVLPAQTLRDGGRLRLVVVNGFIERIDAAELPEPVRGRIEGLARPLVGRPGLTLGEIERPLLLAGDTPGVALRSALSAGERPGGTVLTFGADYRPLTGFVGVDNTLSDALGEWAVTAGFEANSPFALGEVIYVRAAAHPDLDGAGDLGGLFDENPRLRSLAAGAVVPLGLSGLTLNVEAVRSRTTPELRGGIQSASEFERLSFRLRYPWVRSRGLDVGADLILDVQSEELDLITDDGDALPLSEDDLRILRLGADAQRRLDSGALVLARAVVSFGLDALGARGAEDATETLPLSRAGADADFAKLEVVASYTRPLAERLAVSLYARGQTSFGDPLVRSEQIGTASFRELSTFDAGTLGGDSGWILRGDVLSPRSFDAPRLPFTSVTPYAFAAVGALHLEEPTAPEVETLRTGALGVGVELADVIDPAFSYATLTVEYGRAFRDDDLADENRFTLLSTLRF